MKVTVTEESAGFDPRKLRRGDLCMYGEEVCIRTDFDFDNEGAFVCVLDGKTYLGDDDFTPFHGTVLLDTEEA